ncbi:nucleoside diphosphate kinase 6-like isoform X2 [Oratosquilla oratoria]|uniref:nucleoside diphosphate kinase 6-like isoform X2 n=1 Tax=Oratosquilla oratoria TaxID=337810 RepID=UPI003F76AFAE
MNSKIALQLTLALIKPDVTKVPPVLQAIHKRILDEKFMVIRQKMMHLTTAQTENFYAEHKGKFFYNRLVTFMSSGPTQALILCHEDAISRWRQIMGPTKVYRTQYEAPDTLRGMYGLTDTRNCTHGSDAPETAAREIGFFFPEFDIGAWQRTDYKHFLNGNVELNEKEFLHRIVT